jgi:hypothetical protein
MHRLGYALLLVAEAVSLAIEYALAWLECMVAMIFDGRRR